MTDKVLLNLRRGYLRTCNVCRATYFLPYNVAFPYDHHMHEGQILVAPPPKQAEEDVCPTCGMDFTSPNGLVSRGTLNEYCAGCGRSSLTRWPHIHCKCPTCVVIEDVISDHQFMGTLPYPDPTT